jgi:hypothetical protein
MKGRMRTVVGAFILAGLVVALLQRSDDVAHAQRRRGRQPPPPPSIAGDFNQDWQVNVTDLSLFRVRYGSTSAGAQLCQAYSSVYDIWPWDATNNVPLPDGSVNRDDFWTLWYSNPSQVHTIWRSGDVTGLPAKSGCPSDYPNAPPDDYVDFYDLIAFAAHWQTTPTSPNWDPIFDFCGSAGRKPAGTHAPVPVDNVVDFFDLVCLGGDWHKGDGPAPQQTAQALGHTLVGALRLDLDARTPAVETRSEAAPGDEVDVAVVAQGARGLLGYDFKVRFDSGALELLGFDQEKGSFLESRHGKALFMHDLDTPGVIWLTGALVGPDRSRAPRGAGVVARIRFRVGSGSRGPAPIELKDGVVYSADERFAACTPESVAVFVAGRRQSVAQACSEDTKPM